MGILLRAYYLRKRSQGDADRRKSVATLPSFPIQKLNNECRVSEAPTEGFEAKGFKGDSHAETIYIVSKTISHLSAPTCFTVRYSSPLSVTPCRG